MKQKTIKIAPKVLFTYKKNTLKASRGETDTTTMITTTTTTTGIFNS